MERQFEVSDGKKHFDIKLGHMGYDLYVPYSKSCELMDVIELGIRSMESDRDDMLSFVKQMPTFVENGDITEEIGNKLIQDRRHSIAKLDKLLEVAYTTIEQINQV
jgi:hypothetical protein